MEAPLHHESGIQPSRLRRVLHLVERDERKSIRAESSGVLKTQIDPELGLFAILIVPLLAGNLARPTADAVGNVDQRRLDRARGRGKLAS